MITSCSANQYRSPEEYWDKPLDEKIDVWSFGNNLFALLTGRYPFYTLDDDESKKVSSEKLIVCDTFADSAHTSCNSAHHVC
jgi:serine/threonine protein kinase